MIDLAAPIRFHARRTPAAPALTFDGDTIDYVTLAERIRAVAAWLGSQGIGPGNVVAALLRNSPAFLELACATSWLGGVFLPINFRLAADEVGYILGDADARLLVTDDDLPAGAGHDVKTIAIDAAQRRSLAPLGDELAAIAPHFSQPDDLFRIMYTSGTTDRPKGVMHSYDNLHWKCADHSTILGLNPDTRLLMVGPLYHVGAFDLPGLAVWQQGGMIALLRDFDPDTVLAAIAAQKLNGAWLAPVMTSGLLGCATRDQHDVSSLRWVIGGGERTPEARIRDFSALFTEARYIDCYGLTESLSGDCFMEPGREIEKIGSTGRAAPHVEIAILDDDGGQLPPGGEGEICLRGPKIFKGYWRAPEKTAASFVGDWFRTGDVGYLDADGFLFITDRKKDMILSGGENIASSEVERVVQMIPAVAEAAVIGLPDPRWGEVPVAVIVPHAGASLSCDEMIAHCREHLAGFKVPRRLVAVDALPRNPSGKVLKRELRDSLADTSTT